MKHFYLTIFSTLLMLASFQVSAANNFYSCQVVSDALIGGGGNLNVVSNSPRIGEKFSVIKNTGEVIGDVMDSLKNPKVIAAGSEKYAYKVIWVQEAAGKNGAFVDYLSIEESTKGKKKPFGFFSGNLLLTGFCE